MESQQITCDRLAAVFDSDQTPRESTRPVGPRLRAALWLLLEALEYVLDVKQTAWDFAVELRGLRRLGLTNNDLRWLVAKGYVDHAQEITLPGDRERSFRKPPRPLLSRRTCFVLTEAGAACARALEGAGGGLTDRFAALVDSRVLPHVPSPPALVPHWDRDRQELKLGDQVIKRFRVPAANQETVLAAFEEECWPARIDDPLPPQAEQDCKRRLQETIKSLNRNQKRPLIHFLGDGSGQGICWEFSNALRSSPESSRVSQRAVD